ncbi:hypothetical protein [Adhaeribacter aquaticus]|uniref:hypothetical protein n=1 Tax=Adhaeribacter aquaticus TaxID=299567 RepID=UPI000417CA97|nr:hypothetical protein [Adhaeribacter aquaticus]
MSSAVLPIFNTIKRGISLPLFLMVLLGSTQAGLAQTTDSTYQAPQLEQGPPGNPAINSAPARREVPSPVTPAPERTAPPVVSNPEPERVKEATPKVKQTLQEKLFLAGSATLGFSSSSYFGTYFRIGASPMLGYRITKRFAVGPGLSYQYNGINNMAYSDYGAKAFTQVIVFGPILIHAEHALLNTQAYLVNSSGQIVDNYRRNIQETLAGLGYRQMASSKFGYDLYVLFRVNTTDNFNTRNSIPILRAGFIYNFK